VNELGPRFKPGQIVPDTAIYRAIHSGHRMTHEVTVREESIFPKCRRCGFDVRFELVRLAARYSITAEQPLTGLLVPFDHEETETDAAASA
jgi:hypothetical protein